MEEHIHSTEVEEPTIEITNHVYNPETCYAKTGQVIKLLNNDLEDHSFTADNGEFNVTVKSSEYEEMVSPNPGQYTFHCRFHPDMRATLIIIEE